MRRNNGASAIVSLAMGIVLALTAAAQTVRGNLGGSTLEELMKIEVTSVSKKEQSLAKTAAAVYVIGQEDIRRSGANSVPDLLRMAPGVDVAQIDADQWAISVRGFNAVYSNKVLVLVDGRAIFVSTFSGVYWDQLDVPLENIERIEVIRGPGGTVWGANAVNGVIDIITKSAVDTKGGLVAVTGGTQGANSEPAQYGGHAGSKGAYRIFGKLAGMDNSRFSAGHEAADGWRKRHAGLRADWRLSARDTLSVQGDLASGIGGATTNAVFLGATPFQTALNTPLEDTTGDALVLWDRALANGSTSLQVYTSDVRRHEAGAKIDNDMVDVDFSHHLTVGARHDPVWGLAFRTTHDNIVPVEPYSIRFTTPAQRINLFSAFAQDEIQLGKSLFLTVGSKIEHNGFTGLEYEPSAQLIRTFGERKSVWASAARAIRQPDRSEFSAEYDLGLVPVTGVGDAVLFDYEAGCRTQATRRLSLDFSGYLQDFHDLETNEPGTPYFTLNGGSPLLVLPLLFGNMARARDWGFKAFGTWKVSSRRKISPAYSTLKMNAKADPASHDTVAALLHGNSPSQQFQIRSAVALRKNTDWDGSYKYVTALSSLGVPGYGRLDTRVAWRPLETVEVSVTGQNLASRRHD